MFQAPFSTRGTQAKCLRARFWTGRSQDSSADSGGQFDFHQLKLLQLKKWFEQWMPRGDR